MLAIALPSLFMAVVDDCTSDPSCTGVAAWRTAYCDMLYNGASSLGFGVGSTPTVAAQSITMSNTPGPFQESKALYGDNTWSSFVTNELSCCKYAGVTAGFVTIDDRATRKEPAFGESMDPVQNQTFPSWGKAKPVYETHAYIFEQCTGGKIIIQYEAKSAQYAKDILADVCR